jgi:hypothetical protein
MPVSDDSYHKIRPQGIFSGSKLHPHWGLATNFHSIYNVIVMNK